MNVEEPFYNRWVDLDHLPPNTPEQFLPIESEYLYVRLTSVVVFSLVTGLPIALFVLLSGWSLSIKFIILLGFLLISIVWGILVWLEFKQRGYIVREQDIAYRRGLLFRTRQYLPFRRVQHCKISEGVVDRIFNFATIIVSAAGDDIVVQGLRPDVASALQKYINDRVDYLNKEMQDGTR